MSEETHAIRLRVNGEDHEVTVPVRLTLADLLRTRLSLTGTHLGCEHGVCGACTVLVDGASARSCLILAVQADGTEVTTVEGLAEPDGTMSPIQRAFMEHHALQCGYCTPGFLTSITEFLRENPDPTRQEATEAVSGNICRCTGYSGIVDATLAAAAEMRGEGAGA